MMKLLILSRYSRLGASSRYRFFQFVPALEAQGIEVTISPLMPEGYLEQRYAGGAGKLAAPRAYARRVRELLSAGAYDLVWIQNEALPWVPDALEALLVRSGTPYAVDYDDAIFHRYDTHGRGLVRRLLGDKIARVMRRAALVTAGNAYIADYAERAGAERVAVVPTVVDLDRYPVVPPSDHPFTIGWIGSPSTSAYLDQLRPVLAEFCQAHGARVVAMGSRPLDWPEVPITVLPWSEESEVGCIQGFDVGIMPLADSPWERGKCGLKLIQYMAAGRPVIGTPVGVNAEIIAEGENGFTATTPEEWRQALETLYQQPALRRQMGEAGRRMVEARYSLQGVAPRLADLLKEAAGARHGKNEAPLVRSDEYPSPLVGEDGAVQAPGGGEDANDSAIPPPTCPLNGGYLPHEGGGSAKEKGDRMRETVAVIGLGYVGLPVALGFARAFPHAIGFDINQTKVEQLKAGLDVTGEIAEAELKASSLQITADPEALKAATFFVVAVPTPIDQNHNPDLTPLIKSSETVGKALKPGDVVVYESTVYPGVTEEVCGPILARVSGLTQGQDFKLGYSPERINPGDKEHTLEKIIKVVSGEDPETLERVASAYAAVVTAGVHKAPSIKVAEAAKVIENTQRDLNIALMNELALIFDRLGIRTRDVLAAARTKWNFLPFSPGLVGGHCIGVDPYYLTTKAEEVGYHPQVILAGRRINDGMGAYVAQKLVKMLIHADKPVKGAKVAILGLTFKEDVPDIRNSRVPDIVDELRQFEIEPLIHDPLAEAHEAAHEYGLALTPWEALKDLDGLVLAVGHREYKERADLLAGMKSGGVVVDVKSMLEPTELPAHLSYWSL